MYNNKIIKNNINLWKFHNFIFLNFNKGLTHAFFVSVFYILNIYLLVFKVCTFLGGGYRFSVFLKQLVDFFGFIFILKLFLVLWQAAILFMALFCVNSLNLLKS